ncbi:MAG TPA: helix-turn-helix domain-containing protein [Leptolyngbyaceae cyanobacterium M33_DOE_097]|nr:helix-turn-helix domain-containing protein [Leptolyngbyaceae cyanobacterium M33_DOE_097]
MNNRNLQSKQGLSEQLAEIGYHLQTIRQERQISYEDVAAKTHIPIRTLKALEFGDLQQLPEPVYIQGFLRRYAEMLGIAPQEIALDWSSASGSDRPSSVGARFGLTRLPQLRPIHLYLVYIALVVAAVSGLSQLLNQPAYQKRVASVPAPANPPASRPPSPNVGSAQPVAPNSTVTNPTADAIKPDAVQPDTTPKSNKSIRVGIRLVGQSWVRVVADGKTAFEGVLQEGTEQSWEANGQITVRAGNAGGVMVSVNDSTPQPMGGEGSVEEKTFGASKSAEVPTDSGTNRSSEAETTSVL